MTLRFLWSGLITGVIYRLGMYRNGSELEALQRYNHDIDDQYYQVSTVAYISSDGDDELSFGCRSDNPPLYPFDIYSGQHYNQLAIEYVGEY